MKQPCRLWQTTNGELGRSGRSRLDRPSGGTYLPEPFNQANSNRDQAMQLHRKSQINIITYVPNCNVVWEKSKHERQGGRRNVQIPRHAYYSIF